MAKPRHVLTALMIGFAVAACGQSAQEGESVPAAPTTIAATSNPDAFVGGEGVDTVSYADAPERIYLVFGDLSNSTGWAAGDTFTSVENIIGTRFNDVIAFGDGANVIDAGEGNDELIGQGGDDTLIGGLGADVYGFTGPGFGNDTITLFEAGERIDFSRYAGMSFDRLTIVAAPGGVLVSVGEDSITLRGVTLDQVDRTRFAFPS